MKNICLWERKTHYKDGYAILSIFYKNTKNLFKRNP